MRLAAFSGYLLRVLIYLGTQRLATIAPAQALPSFLETLGRYTLADLLAPGRRLAGIRSVAQIVAPGSRRAQPGK